jgi:hypothetical protein
MPATRACDDAVYIIASALAALHLILPHLASILPMPAVRPAVRLDVRLKWKKKFHPMSSIKVNT